jgi:dienelactone hydrolase
MMKWILLLSVFLPGAVPSSAQTSLKEMALSPGSYHAAYRHYVTADSTRTYRRLFDWNNQNLFRPISISLWYPSAASVGERTPLTVLDYMEVLKEEEEWEYLPDEQILNWFYYANTADNQRHLGERTQAYRNLAPAPGKFPVVVYAPSYQASSVENFSLCAYLASHGYIVIASPSRGTASRPLEGGTAKDMETQARDIEFLIREISGYPHADVSEIATMGFSFGGLSNVLSQMRNKKIKAIVSLDGSVKYQYATLEKSPYFDLKRMDVPFIHMAQKQIPAEVLKEDKLDPALNTRFRFYDSLAKSNAYRLRFNDLTHGCFSTLGVLFGQRDRRQDKSDAAIMSSYQWVNLYSLQFLDAYLKRDTGALRFINDPPVRNGVPMGLITYEHKPPQNNIFTFEDFNELAAGQAYLQLETLYDSMQREYPAFSAPGWKLNNLGLQLVFRPGKSKEGISVLLFATRLYPSSANLFDSLAEAYLFIGDKEKAREAFERSLGLDAHNENAVRRLKELGR